MEKFNDTEFKELPKDEECMVTAVKIGEILNEPAHTIRKWAEYHEENMYIKKINGRFAYTQESIEQFKFVKDLVRNKNMTHEQVRQHMNKHGSQYSQYDGGLIDTKDPLGYKALSSAIALENQKQLQVFMENFIQYQEENNKKIMFELKREVAITAQEVIEESLKTFKEELLITRETNEKIDKLRESMEMRKEESEKKGLFSRFFTR